MRCTAFRCPGQLRPPYLAESPELHPTDNLAGTAAATSILRKFDTNTEAATANQSIMFIASATASGCGRSYEGSANGEFRQPPAGRSGRRDPAGRASAAPRRRAATAGRPAARLAGWAEPDVVDAFADRGISSPWSHQAEAAELAYAGRHVVIGTGPASGKSLAYQLLVLNALATDSRARALYLSPTRRSATTSCAPHMRWRPRCHGWLTSRRRPMTATVPTRCAALPASAPGGCSPTRR